MFRLTFIKNHILTQMTHNKPNTANQAKTNYNLSYNDYYPYGMLVPTRNYSNPVYRYGFQGQEKDDELLTAVFMSQINLHLDSIGKKSNVDSDISIDKLRERELRDASPKRDIIPNFHYQLNERENKTN